MKLENIPRHLELDTDVSPYIGVTNTQFFEPQEYPIDTPNLSTTTTLFDQSDEGCEFQKNYFQTPMLGNGIRFNQNETDPTQYEQQKQVLLRNTSQPPTENAPIIMGFRSNPNLPVSQFSPISPDNGIRFNKSQMDVSALTESHPPQLDWTNSSSPVLMDYTSPLAPSITQIISEKSPNEGTSTPLVGLGFRMDSDSTYEQVQQEYLQQRRQEEYHRLVLEKQKQFQLVQQKFIAHQNQLHRQNLVLEVQHHEQFQQMAQQVSPQLELKPGTMSETAFTKQQVQPQQYQEFEIEHHESELQTINAIDQQHELSIQGINLESGQFPNIQEISTMQRLEQSLDDSINIDSSILNDSPSTIDVGTSPESFISKEEPSKSLQSNIIESGDSTVDEIFNQQDEILDAFNTPMKPPNQDISRNLTDFEHESSSSDILIMEPMNETLTPSLKLRKFENATGINATPANTIVLPTTTNASRSKVTKKKPSSTKPKKSSSFCGNGTSPTFIINSVQWNKSQSDLNQKRKDSGKAKQTSLEAALMIPVVSLTNYSFVYETPDSMEESSGDPNAPGHTKSSTTLNLMVSLQQRNTVKSLKDGLNEFKVELKRHKQRDGH